MLAFIRKIRRNLISNSSINRYLVYAIGEISLVVIGILIALQINNWNENHKIRELELSTLQELSVALGQDTMTAREARNSMFSKYNSCKTLLDHISRKAVFTPTLDSLFLSSYTFHTSTFNRYNTAAFDLLKDRGLDIIKNQELRNKIAGHYTNHLAVITSWYENVQKMHALQADRLFDNFKIDQDLSEEISMKPKNYDQLLADETLVYPFYHFKTLTLSSINRLNTFLSQTRELLQEVNEAILSKGGN